jgi:hypothetical protein
MGGPASFGQMKEQTKWSIGRSPRLWFDSSGYGY